MEVFEFQMQEFESMLNPHPKGNIVVAGVDGNCNVGSARTDDELRWLGPHGVGSRDERGTQFVQMCMENGLYIGNCREDVETRHRFTRPDHHGGRGPTVPGS